MANERVYNFSAGPSMLPVEVLQRAGPKSPIIRVPVCL